MLLVGQDVRRPPDLLGRADPLDELVGAARSLSVSGADVGGVIERLAARAGLDPPKFPQTVLDAWAREFGGDLVAFNAALVGHLRRGDSHFDRLSPDDARDYLRERYLANLDDSGVRSLLTVAAFSRLGLPVAGSLLDRQALTPAVEDGVVHVVEQSGELVYVFAHPALGRLILDAHGDRRPEGELLAQITDGEPMVAKRVARRLLQEKRPSTATPMLALAVRRAGGLAEILIQERISALASSIQLLREASVASPKQIDESLEPRSGVLGARLAEEAARIGMPLLSYLRRRGLPRTYLAIVDWLEGERAANRLVAQWSELPFADALPDLRLIAAHLPGVAGRIADAFAAPERLDEVADWLDVRNANSIQQLRFVPRGDALVASALARQGPDWIRAIVQTWRAPRDLRVSARGMPTTLAMIRDLANDERVRAAVIERAHAGSEGWLSALEWSHTFHEPSAKELLDQFEVERLDRIISDVARDPDLLRRLLQATRQRPSLQERILQALGTPQNARLLAEMLPEMRFKAAIGLLRALHKRPQTARAVLAFVASDGRGPRIAQRIRPGKVRDLESIVLVGLGPAVLPHVSLAAWEQALTRKRNRLSPEQVELLAAPLRDVGRRDLCELLTRAAASR